MLNPRARGPFAQAGARAGLVRPASPCERRVVGAALENPHQVGAGLAKPDLRQVLLGLRRSGSSAPEGRLVLARVVGGRHDLADGPRLRRSARRARPGRPAPRAIETSGRCRSSARGPRPSPGPRGEPPGGRQDELSQAARRGGRDRLRVESGSPRASRRPAGGGRRSSLPPRSRIAGAPGEGEEEAPQAGRDPLERNRRGAALEQSSRRARARARSRRSGRVELLRQGEGEAALGLGKWRACARRPRRKRPSARSSSSGREERGGPDRPGGDRHRLPVDPGGERRLRPERGDAAPAQPLPLARGCRRAGAPGGPGVVEVRPPRPPDAPARRTAAASSGQPPRRRAAVGEGMERSLAQHLEVVADRRRRVAAELGQPAAPVGDLLAGGGAACAPAAAQCAAGRSLPVAAHDLGDRREERAAGERRAPAAGLRRGGRGARRAPASSPASQRRRTLESSGAARPFAERLGGVGLLEERPGRAPSRRRARAPRPAGSGRRRGSRPGGDRRQAIEMRAAALRRSCPDQNSAREREGRASAASARSQSVAPASARSSSGTAAVEIALPGEHRAELRARSRRRLAGRAPARARRRGRRRDRRSRRREERPSSCRASSVRRARRWHSASTRRKSRASPPAGAGRAGTPRSSRQSPPPAHGAEEQRRRRPDQGLGAPWARSVA